MLGFSYDWDREVDTTDPEYFKWTQWIFLQLFNSYYDPELEKAQPISLLQDALAETPQRQGEWKDNPFLAGTRQGFFGKSEAAARELVRQRFIPKMRLAYESEVPVWWCEGCKAVLANEEVNADGTCDRKGHKEVYRRPLRQWILRITKYADRLLKDLELVNWPESIKEQQRNWIGRSEGAEVDFKTEAGDVLRVFTTRPDTLFGATYMVLAPEHSLVSKVTTEQQRAAVDAYQTSASTKSELERTQLEKEKTGVFTGGYAINPVNNEKIPIWVADYVMMGYGTGAIMAVPAHDTRDFEFAKKFGLEIRTVVEPPAGTDPQGFTGDGTSVNSGPITGLPTPEAKKKITAWLEEKKLGKPTVQYKLRDWLFSRQRYWGEPIPIVHCETHGAVAVPESELPLDCQR